MVLETKEMTHPSGRTSSQGRWVGVISSSGLAGLALPCPVGGPAPGQPTGTYLRLTLRSTLLSFLCDSC